MLSGTQIQRDVDSGVVRIEPFSKKQVGPNSYDVRLAPMLLRVLPSGDGCPLDVRAGRGYETRELLIPDCGAVLAPGQCYLGATVEWIDAGPYVACYAGRSTIGRYFVTSHATAGLGDVGYRGSWTLEIQCAMPIRVYPRMRIGQVFFLELTGAPPELYKGAYSNRVGESVPMKARAGNV